LISIIHICKKYNIILIEDAAHAYGIKYKNKLIGTFGISCGISTQANKLINSGEGGFILTNNDNIMSYCIVASGCYENYYKKHEVLCPKFIEKYLKNTPNFSLRMSNITGALILPQIMDIENRIKKINNNYDVLKKTLKSKYIEVLTQLDLIRPVYDSIQIRFLNITNEQLNNILYEVNHKFKLQYFLSDGNARFYKNWKFMKNSKCFHETEKNLYNVVDMRIHIDTSVSEIELFGKIITNSIINNV